MKKVVLIIRILGILFIVYLLLRPKEIDFVKLGLYKSNPNSYVFHASMEKIITVLNDCKKDFARELEYDSEYYKVSNDYLKNSIIKNHPEFNRLLKSENQNDFLILRYYGVSKIYRSDDSGISYLAHFHIHLDSLDVNKTKITINTMFPEIHVKVNWIISHAPGFYETYKLNQGSSIEEYIILRTIGKKLNLVDSMPEIIIPNKVLGHNEI